MPNTNYNWDSLGMRPSDKTLAPLLSTDERPSQSRIFVDEKRARVSQPHAVVDAYEFETDVQMILEVKDDAGRLLGTLVVRGNSSVSSGPVGNHGVSLFTREELLYAD